ncbi:tRNA (adenine(22)-N(1))-methyltransferase TrmK [Shewanella sp. GD04112]|uniref:tRNA (adenine(22)-N(1))-methyltransferase n=1 Tax=Shewanella sp. GD04112 TaxID=2975434 RepID=UPI00244CA887|nr:tRNA (adenine(22)-N(1))-methyltransferase TrmK [Shewanella sp. GD04112]MDH0448536.1 tRNA (adenine(22)-N(1))-methyltransferase TrmK [Shewanella sp. GD04112]
MKISQRLQQINRMVGPGYDHIWDCCCDHGLLGMLLLQRNAALKVHFVDCVAPLMQQLSLELARFFPQQPISTTQNAIEQTTNLQSEWQVHCLDVAALPLAQYGKQAKHLVIIAGVGGELLVELVRSIVANQQSQSDAHSGNDSSNHDLSQGACQLEFILCPVHHNYHVRSALAELGLSLKDEYLLEENQRFYEILHLTQANACSKTITSSKTTEAVPLSATGSIMWQGLDADKTNQAKRYLDQTIGHYQRIPAHRMPNKSQIVAAYQHILQQLNC